MISPINGLDSLEISLEFNYIILIEQLNYFHYHIIPDMLSKVFIIDNSYVFFINPQANKSSNLIHIL